MSKKSNTLLAIVLHAIVLEVKDLGNKNGVHWESYRHLDIMLEALQESLSQDELEAEGDVEE